MLPNLLWQWRAAWPTLEFMRNALFESVTLVTTFECHLCMPYENHKPIWVARGLRAPWPDMWRDMKHYE